MVFHVLNYIEWLLNLSSHHVLSKSKKKIIIINEMRKLKESKTNQLNCE